MTKEIGKPRVGRFFAIDPLTSKYPWYTPYSFSGNKVINSVEIEGLEPEEIIKKEYKKSTVTIYPEKDDVDQKPKTVEVTFVVLKFNESASHLLSLVSRISEEEIRKITLSDGNGILPAYKVGVDDRFIYGGGAITLPSQNNYNISFTSNYFTNQNGGNYKSIIDYGNNIYEWFEICSHEVGHIKDIKEIGKTLYAATFLTGYLVKGHDNYWREKRADKGQNKFIEFNNFLNNKYGNDSLINLFKNIDLSQDEKTKQIDNWWNEYVNSIQKPDFSDKAKEKREKDFIESSTVKKDIIPKQ